MHRTVCATIVVVGLAFAAAVFVAAGDLQGKTETYYEGRSVKVVVTELEPSAAAAVLARNSPLYSVYASDGCEPEGRMFVKVIDRLEGDGTSTLWRGIQIEFNPGYPCHQFRSVQEITTAVNTGEISLHPTGYVYRCRLVAPDE